MIRTALVATGSELVHGNVQEYNNYYLSNRLFSSGCNVIAHFTVGDDPDMITRVINEALNAAELVIMTGGLGPTEDDRTVEVLGAIWDIETIVNENALTRMEKYFHGTGRDILDGDMKMVTVPRDAVVFENKVGLAPGFALQHQNKTLISMPGVPVEMKHMFEQSVFQYIQFVFKTAARDSYEFRIVLTREAEVNRRIASLEIPFDRVSWTITTRPGINRVVFYADDDRQLPGDTILGQMKREFGNSLLVHGYDSLEKELLYRLNSCGFKMATAESCTGGLIAGKVTDIPGSSDVFNGSIVAYSNEAKMNLLDVSGSSLREHGAVSETVAGEMAEGARVKLGADVAVSTTGVAGPGGGTPAKPVGMVCFGLSTGEGVETFTMNFGGDRWRNREYSAMFSIGLVRDYCIGKKEC